MKIRAIPAALAAAALSLSLAACGGGTESAGPAGTDGELTPLQVGIVGIGSDAAITMAQEKGFFEEEGLDVETTVVANPPAGIAAAQSGQLDLAYTPSIPLLNALSQSVPLTVVAAADGYPADVLETSDPGQADDTGLFAAAGSGIDSPGDLEGKTVAVPARNAQLEVTIANAIREDGGDPSSVNWMVLDPASALQSLEQGRVDAAGLVAPFTARAEESGATFLAAPGVEFFGDGAVGLWVAGQDTVEAQSEALAAFQRAIYRANAYANEHLDEAQQTASEVTGVDLETIQAGAENYWPAEVRLEDIQRVNEKLVELGYLQEEVPVDDSLILSGD